MRGGGATPPARPQSNSHLVNTHRYQLAEVRRCGRDARARSRLSDPELVESNPGKHESHPILSRCPEPYDS
jgi:hypothetical protein